MICFVKFQFIWMSLILGYTKIMIPLETVQSVI